MEPNNNIVEQLSIKANEPIKAKRGRKSKKDLMATLNMESLVKEKDTKKNIQTQNKIILNVSEIVSKQIEKINTDCDSNVYTIILNDNDDDANLNNNIVSSEEPKIPKKRGRKPKEKIYSIKELPKSLLQMILVTDGEVFNSLFDYLNFVDQKYKLKRKEPKIEEIKEKR